MHNVGEREPKDKLLSTPRSTPYPYTTLFRTDPRCKSPTTQAPRQPITSAPRPTTPAPRPTTTRRPVPTTTRKVRSEERRVGKRVDPETRPSRKRYTGRDDKKTTKGTRKMQGN